MLLVVAANYLSIYGDGNEPYRDIALGKECRERGAGGQPAFFTVHCDSDAIRRWGFTDRV